MVSQCDPACHRQQRRFGTLLPASQAILIDLQIVLVQWLHDPVADVAVTLDDREFFGGQLARLEQDRIRQPDLAHVVKLCGQAEHVCVRFGKTQLAGQDRHVPPDADDVAAGGVVAIFRGAGEAEDHLQPRDFQLGRARPHLLLELLGIAGQVIVMRLDDQRVANTRDQVVGIDRLGKEIGGLLRGFAAP